MALLDALQITHGEHIDASIIWLHGLGADGNDFAPVVEELNLLNTRFILPHAPYRAVSLNNGYQMRAWYDIYGLGLDSKQDASGIAEMQLHIEALIAQEIARGIPAGRIVLAGFSQGGAMALHTALRYQARLAGAVGLSTYLPLKSSLAAEANTVNRDMPIYMAHGSFDSVITLAIAEHSAAILREQGYALQWHEYAMPHSVCAEEIHDIRAFLGTVLGK